MGAAIHLASPLFQGVFMPFAFHEKDFLNCRNFNRILCLTNDFLLVFACSFGAISKKCKTRTTNRKIQL